MRCQVGSPLATDAGAAAGLTGGDEAIGLIGGLAGATGGATAAGLAGGATDASPGGVSIAICVGAGDGPVATVFGTVTAGAVAVGAVGWAAATGCGFSGVF